MGNKNEETNGGQTVFKEEGKASMNPPSTSQATTSTGLNENVAGMLTYVLGFITGIIFLVLEKENRFVRFHALQSIFTFGALFVLNLVLTSIPFIGWLIGILLTPLMIILWVVMLVKAYQGKWFKLPIVGDIAEKQLK